MDFGSLPWTIVSSGENNKLFWQKQTSIDLQLFNYKHQGNYNQRKEENNEQDIEQDNDYISLKSSGTDSTRYSTIGVFITGNKNKKPINCSVKSNSVPIDNFLDRYCESDSDESESE